MAEMSKQKRKTKKRDDYLVQGAILAAATVITKIIGVVYRIPLTNILGDEGNGFYGYAYQVYAIALMLSSLSLPTAVSKLVSERNAARQRRNAFRVFVCTLVFAAVVGLMIAGAIFFGAGAISEHFMKSPLSVYALRVLAPGLFICAVMSVLRGYFQGLNTMVPTAISQIIEQLINAVVSIVGASVLFGMGSRAAKTKGTDLLGAAYGAAGGTLGTVMGALAGLLFLLFAFWLYSGSIKRQIRRDRTANVESYRHILKVLLLTAIPIVFSTAIYNINQILDLTIFNHVMDAQGYAEKEYMALQGIYTGKYDTLINVPMSIPYALSASIVPSLTAAVTAGSRRQVYGKIDQTLRLTMILAVPSCVGFLVLASPLMVLLYNDSSATPANLLMLGSAVIVLYGWSTITNSVLHGLNHMTEPAKNAAISLVVHLIALVVMLGIFKWGVYALVGSNIVFAVCMCFLNQRKIRQICGFKINWMYTFGKPGLASAIMGIVTYAVHLVVDLLVGGRVVPTVCAILAAVIVYLIIILRIGTVSEEDILALPMGTRLLHYSKKFHLFVPRESMEYDNEE